MTHPALRVLARAVGTFCLICGALGVVLCVAAFIDPAGMQAADDGNPFGAPPSRLKSAFGCLLSLWVAVMGARMIPHRNTPP